MWSAAYLAGAAGLVVVHERLRADFRPDVALLTTLLLFGATSLFWSMTRGTIDETAAFGLVASLLLVSERWAPFPYSRVTFWCLAAAAPAAVRYVLGVAPAGSDRAGGDWMAMLFSPEAGLLSLTPVVYVALLGTLAYVRRSVFWGLGALSVFALWVVLSFFSMPGARTPRPFDHGLTSTLAVLAPGLALVIDWARVRPLVTVAPLVILALAWNHGLMVQYTAGLLPKDEPIRFASMVRQQADVLTQRPYVYPFAFPANAWFAWREGIPVERYDVLAGEPRRAAIDLRMDRQADRFLLEGWDAPGSDALGPVHWIGARRATIVLPLEITPGRDVSIEVTARTRLEAPAVQADLGVEINGHEIGRFDVPAAVPTEARLTVPASAVGRVLRAGYNRLTLVSHGVRRVDPADQRPPGPLASRTGTRTWPVAIYRIRITPAS